METKKESASIYIQASTGDRKAESQSPAKGGHEKGSKSSDDGDDDSQSEPEMVLVNPRPNPISYIFFSFIDPLISRGRKRRLEPEDCMKLESLKTEGLYSRFDEHWKQELATGQPDIRKAIIRDHWGPFLLTALFYLISQATTFAGPILLQRIVSGLACRQYAKKAGLVPDEVCVPVRTLYLYSIGLFAAPFIALFTDNHSTYMLNLIGTKMRNALMAAIYRKCLRASNAALQRESTGKIVTLMSNDAQKLQDVMLAVHSCWGSPLYIMAILAMLYLQVKWATFVGLFVMLLLGPVTGIVATKLARFRRSILQYVDRRISIVSEVIPGIRVIKFYAWENSFLSRVMELRRNEIRIMKGVAVLSGAFGMLLFAGPVAVALFCFMSYTLAGNTLTTANAYAALAYFTMLRFPMSFLPMFIQQVVTANVALKRIQGFLMQPEAPDQEDSTDGLAPGTVLVRNATFAWELREDKERREQKEIEEARRMAEEDKKGKKRRGGPPGAGGPPGGPRGGPPAAPPKPKINPDEPPKPWAPTLVDINLEVQRGQLVMVAGSVGSGKSSLLSALIRNIAKVSGSVQVAGSVAYVAQTSWIINDSLRENVLMGEAFDSVRYELALRVSQLEADLKILPQGDMTEIGERGITLSGGQKQRVSIARAVYMNADIYVLDDPLSAVDSHVGRALFEKCIKGALKDKTVILVTNALYYLPFADHILWLEDGRIAESGTYTKLMEAGGNFSQLVSKNVVQEDHGAEAEAPTQEAKNVKSLDGKPAKGPVKGIAGPGAGGPGGKNLTGIEEREQGNVAWPIIRDYVKAAGGLTVAFTVVALFAVEQCLKVGTDLWLGVWTQNRAHMSRSFYIGLYFCWGVVYSLMTFIRSVTFYFATLNASRTIHNLLLNHVLALPMEFFDTNPSGRVINRFSRDVEIMDSVLPGSVVQFLGCIASLLCTFFLLCIAMPYFTIAFGPITIFYIIIQRYYITSARELQRIESITRSPIYALFGEAITGVATIRAYRKAGHFTRLSDSKIYENASAFITQKAAASWLSMRLDVIGLVTVTLAGLLAVNGNIDPGVAGLVLVYALDITKYLKQGTNMASKSETDFNSVERIVQYLRPSPEAASETDKAVLAAMPPTWPAKGHILVEKLEMRYREDTPLVLRGVTFEVQGGEKVGICGRTGSGKSSIFLVFFRMVEPMAGRIVIDGVDISTLGLRHLRASMSMIPQDPLCFSGTVRRNLDPFSQQSDEELWGALASVGLKPAIEALPDKLEATVVDGGSNFSQGQRQLICLARALLRKSRVLMMDEATASVDMDTDALIQATVREKFAECTVLTIAHRLNTIMDSDKVLVMDAGRVAEYDRPTALLETPNSRFAALVDETGKNNAVHLRKMATTKGAGSRQVLSELADTPRKDE